MKYLLFIASFLSICLTSTAQDAVISPSRFDVRCGVGSSLLGTGDMRTFMFETELNYRLNNYLATSGNIALGNSNRGVFKQTSFTQGNLNLFISPFKNVNRNDLRIGGGISTYHVNDACQSSATFLNGVLIDSEHVFDSRYSVGGNIVIENTYLITPRILIGAKIFAQRYLSGDSNVGWQLRLGVKI